MKSVLKTLHEIRMEISDMSINSVRIWVRNTRVFRPEIRHVNTQGGSAAERPQHSHK